MLKKCFIMIATLIVCANNALALNGVQVMDKVYAVSKQFKTEKYQTMMEVSSKSRTRVSYFQTCTSRRHFSDTLIRFYRPVSLKGTGLLINKSKTGENDTRLYLPSLRSVKKIVGEDKNKSFMGSDFTYADITGRELSDDYHTLTKTDDTYYYVTSVPKKSSSYSKFKYKISKGVNIPVSIKFYNKNGVLSKVLYNKKLIKIKAYSSVS